MTEQDTPGTHEEAQTPGLPSEGPGLRVLLTGATGFIGARVLRDLAGHHQVFAAHHSGLDLAGIEPAFITPVHWEAESGSPEALIALVDPAVVVHLLAITRTEACAQDPQRATLLNLTVTKRLAQAAFYRGTRFIFTSTDLVFDGKKSMVSEQDTPNPTNTYARTKWEAEQALNTIFRPKPDLLTIFRIGLSYGWGAGQHQGPAGWVIEKLKARQRVDLFGDEFRSPLFLGDACRAIREAIETPHPGLYHLGGSERIDRYTLGVKMAARFGLDAGYIQRRSVADYPGPEPRSPDCSMNITKFQDAFGWTPCGVEEGLNRMAAETQD
jgi:dTDP-4-dehydrorhamnose reductase